MKETGCWNEELRTVQWGTCCGYRRQGKLYWGQKLQSRLKSRCSIWPSLLRTFLVLKLKVLQFWNPFSPGQTRMVSHPIWRMRKNQLCKEQRDKQAPQEERTAREKAPRWEGAWHGQGRVSAGRKLQEQVKRKSYAGSRLWSGGSVKEFWLIWGAMERYRQVFCREWYDLIF